MEANEPMLARSTSEESVTSVAPGPRHAPKLRRVEPSAERPSYDLAERDVETIRGTLPWLRTYTEIYHRAEVRNLERVSDSGPVLVVGNHSGGMFAPDAPVFAVPFIDRFGAERPLFLLSHDIVFQTPFGSSLRKWGMMPATRANTRLALEAGHVVMVFPGGDYDCFRPTSESARIDFGGRKGFIDVALESGAPIVPVVQIGAQETQLFLTRGEWLAPYSPFAGSVRSKLAPLSFGFPFGLTMGGFNLPLPAKITAQVLAPIDVRARFGRKPDRDEVYEHLTTIMQEALDNLARERRWPIIG